MGKASTSREVKNSPYISKYLIPHLLSIAVLELYIEYLAVGINYGFQTDIEVFTFDSESAGKTFVVDFDVVDASWLLGTKRGIHIEGYDEVVVCK